MFTQLLIAKSGCAEEQRKEFYFIWFTCRVNLCPAQFSFDHNLLDFAYHSSNLSKECSVLIDYVRHMTLGLYCSIRYFPTINISCNRTILMQLFEYASSFCLSDTRGHALLHGLLSYPVL